MKLGIDDGKRKAVCTLTILISEVAGNVFVKTIETLRQLQGNPSLQQEMKNEPYNKSLTPAQNKVLKDLANGTRNLEDIDISLLWQILKNKCGLPKNDKHWTESGPISDGAELEHYLTKVKSLRNEIVHEYRFLLRQSYIYLSSIERQIVEYLHKIIRKVNVTVRDRNDWINQLEEDLKSAGLTECAGIPKAQAQYSQASIMPESMSIVRSTSLKLRSDIEQIFKENKYDPMADFRTRTYIDDWNRTHPPLSEAEVMAEMNGYINFFS